MATLAPRCAHLRTARGRCHAAVPRRPAAILRPIIALAIGVAMNPSFAQAAAQPMHPGEPGYELLLEAATAPLREVLEARVALDVERMDRIGPWVFLLGNMRAPDGGRPDFSGTRFADASEQGAMSDLYVALLRHDSPAAPSGDTTFPADGTWVVLDHAIGPGDVAWLGWPQEHAAPRALFGF